MANLTAKKVLGTAFNVIVGRDKKRHGHGDPTREVFETIVFVVVLVLMLKLFVAEAFVIPTGSMASTLWGDQVKVECPECEFRFPVSAAASHGRPRTEPKLTYCQNCGLAFAPKAPRDFNSGDRVLVGKYEYHVRDPKRFDVPVFRYPVEPYSSSEQSAMNYIKRLIGLPGETIGILHGKLFRNTSLTYPDRARPERAEDLWMRENMYPNDPEAIASFEKGGFEMIRKSPKEIITVRRLLFDLDRQPKSLTGVARTRWHPVPDDGTGWTMNEKGFDHTGVNPGWVRYHHVEPGSWSVGGGQTSTPRQPAYILDHLSYNVSDGTRTHPPEVLAHYWVPDLSVDCEAKFSSENDSVTLELNKGSDKFRAVFTGGTCKLFRVASSTPDKPALLAEQPTMIKGAGTYSLSFANVDCRLTVWVNGKVLPFGPAADYPPTISEKSEPTTADLNEPARIGAVGNVEVSSVKLWRDVYYTSTNWMEKDGIYQGNVQTYYVQPGHYLCLGDNSASSADGRTWGLVPERLMLGRAVVIYWPVSRIRVIK